MTKQTAASTIIAAAFLFGTGVVSFAQSGAKTPTQATGSGKDTGMQVPSGMSGNGPAGVGTVASPAATGSGSGKTSSSKHKKAMHHSKKHA